MAKISNELHRRRIGRKATSKENNIFKKVKTITKSKLKSHNGILIVKEQWMDSLRAMKVKLKSVEERDMKIKNNYSTFQNDKSRFIRTMEKQERRQP